MKSYDLPLLLKISPLLGLFILPAFVEEDIMGSYFFPFLNSTL